MEKLIIAGFIFTIFLLASGNYLAAIPASILTGSLMISASLDDLKKTLAK
jgi:hypothetical protein